MSMELDELVNGMISSKLFKSKADAKLWQVEIVQQITQNAKDYLRQNYTPNTEVEQQVLIGRKAELERAVRVYRRGNHYDSGIRERITELDRKISELKGKNAP